VDAINSAMEDINLEMSQLEVEIQSSADLVILQTDALNSDLDVIIAQVP